MLTLAAMLVASSCTSCGFTPSDDSSTPTNKANTPTNSTAITAESLGIPTKIVDDGESTEASEGERLATRGWLVWSDEFDTDGVPDTTKWRYETGRTGWGNEELQNYVSNEATADTASVKDGVLTIKAYYSGSEWRSVRMLTRPSWKYGYIEAKLKVTDKKGAWPAFWMMPEVIRDGQGGKWPDDGEIDIMENSPSTQGEHAVFSTLHAKGHNGGNGASIGKKIYASDLSEDWHTFAVKWTEDYIAAYYDGAFQKYYAKGTKDKTNWPYDQNFFVILNLAIGGQLGGTEDANKLRSEGTDVLYQVDYVRVYQ